MPNNRGGWVWLNSQGREEGGGTTSKARQARRLAAKEKERWEAGEPTAFEKRQEQAKQEAAKTRAQRRVKSTPPPGVSARQHQKVTQAKDTTWMPAGKHGKRQPAEQPLEKGTKALKKDKKQTSTAAASSASSAKPLTKGNNKFQPLTKGGDKMEDSSSSDSEEEVCVEETSSEESSVEKVSSTKNEARLAELKKQLMDAPGNSWAEALKKAGPKATPACLPKEGLKPLTKGNPGGRSSSSKPLKKGPPLLCKKVAIDWRGTLANDANEVSDSAIEAIEKLLGAGCQVYILSYCFQKRQEEVKGHLMSLDIFPRLSGAYFTTKKTGPGGKAFLCKKEGFEALFDDDPDIMKECWFEGIWPFPVQTWHSHSPLEKGSGKWVQPSQTLEDAIKLFLEGCKFHDWDDL